MNKQPTPLTENLRIDLTMIAKDMRRMAINLKNYGMKKVAWKLFLHADIIEEYIERLK